MVVGVGGGVTVGVEAVVVTGGSVTVVGTILPAVVAIALANLVPALLPEIVGSAIFDCDTFKFQIWELPTWDKFHD